MKKVTFLFCCVVFFVSQVISQEEFNLPDIRTFINKEKAVNIPHFSANQQTNKNNPNNNYNAGREINAIPQYLDSIYEYNQDNDLNYVYNYDQLNQLETEYVNYIFDGIQIPYLRIDYTYENDTLIKQKLYNAMDYSNLQWYPIFKAEFDYDNSNILETLTTHDWDDSLTILIPLEQFQYTYNDFGNYNNITVLSYDTSSATWNNAVFLVYGYDANQHLIEYINQEYDDLTSSWVNDFKCVSTYNTLGLKTEYIEYNFVSNSWIPSSKIEYTHNSQSRLNKELHYSWQTSSNSWNISSQTELYYDSFGNMLESLRSNWNTTSLDWKPDARTLRSYNSNYPFVDLVLPWHCFLFTFLWSNPIVPEPYYNFDMITPQYTSMLLIREYQRWDEDDSIWETREVKEYYYSDHITGTPNNDYTTELKIYPNPASDYVIIDIGNNSCEFELIDISGKVILSVIDSENKINIRSIPVGIYLYHVVIHNQEYKGKLVISR